MAIPRTRVLRATCVNAAADAFAQIEIPTGLFAVEQGSGLLIRRIDIQDVTLVGAGTYQKDLALSRRSKTAVPDISDPDCILRWKKSAIQATAVGLVRAEQLVDRYEFPSGDDALIDQLIVEDPLYATIDSNGTGGVITIVLRLQCEIVKVTELQRLALISLSQS